MHFHHQQLNDIISKIWKHNNQSKTLTMRENSIEIMTYIEKINGKYMLFHLISSYKTLELN